MNQNSDLTDLLLALNAEGVEYLVIGGYAFALHVRSRATKDVDLFVRPTPENARRLWQALTRFGAPLESVTPEDFATPGTFFIMGRAPNQIDLINDIDGVSFDQAWQGRVKSALGGVPVSYIGRAELLANKEAAGRPQDLVDAAELRQAGGPEAGAE
jgi:predicted nucleotidyltransferase